MNRIALQAAIGNPGAGSGRWGALRSEIEEEPRLQADSGGHSRSRVPRRPDLSPPMRWRTPQHPPEAVWQGALGSKSVFEFPVLRPFATQMGTQYLEHVNDPGLLSDPLTFFWSPALPALFTRRFAPLGVPAACRRAGDGFEPGLPECPLPTRHPRGPALALALAGALAAHGQRTGSRAVLRRRSSGCSTTMRSGGRPLVAGIAVAAAPEVPKTCASS